MARVFVTGSSQGIGAEAAGQLVAHGHEVVVHGRNADRTRAALDAVPGAQGAVTGALDNLQGTRALAADAAARGPFDVVIHNAAVGPDTPERVETADGHELLFQVNVIAPYLLTCLMPPPARIVYVGSDASDQGGLHLDDVDWRERAWDRWGAYNDSKLYVAMLALEVAHRMPGTRSNVVHPGWVRTRMGGAGAQIELADGADSLVWLAVSDVGLASGTGHFVYRRSARPLNPIAADADARARLMTLLARTTGVTLPDAPAA